MVQASPRRAVTLVAISVLVAANAGCSRTGYGGDLGSPPVITLAGDGRVELFAGESWTDPGATATDLEDGDLTADIVVDSNVDTTTPGDYVVRYNVTDSDGNAATEVVRTVAIVDFALTAASVVNGASSMDLHVTLNGAGVVHWGLYPTAAAPTAAALAAEAAAPSVTVAAGTFGVAVPGLDVVEAVSGVPDDAVYTLYLVADGDVTGLESDADVRTFTVTFPVRHGVVSFDSTSQPGVTVRYWRYVPEAYFRSTTDVFPAVLFLHGWGERGPDDGSQVELVLANAFPEMIEEGEELEFILLAPQCTTGAWDCWNWSTAVVDETLVNAQSALRIDAGRVYVTGLSTGGGGTYHYAMAFPEKVAAIMPTCTTMPNLTNVCNLLDVPVWDFHNEGDATQPAQNSIDTLDALWACAPQPAPAPLYTEYPVTGHNCWDATFRETGAPYPTTIAYDGSTPTPTDVYAWLLSHSK